MNGVISKIKSQNFLKILIANWLKLSKSGQILILITAILVSNVTRKENNFYKKNFYWVNTNQIPEFS